ncbi:MAG: hypothetical protein AAF551_01135, partial [Bacteroidota bacterium]
IDSLEIDLDVDHRIVSPVILSPDTATIFGPKSYIDTLKKRFHINITKREIDRDFDQSVSLGLAEGFNISSTPKTVNVSFNVAQFDDLQVAVPLELLHFPNDSSIVPAINDVTVQFTIRRSLREDFFSEDFKVILDYDMMNVADSTIPTIVMIHPENVLEVEPTPDTVKVIYRE